MKHAVWLLAGLLAACGQNEGGAPAYMVKEEPADAADGIAVAAPPAVGREGESAPKPGIPTATPRIAYSYTIGYRLGDDGIGKAQAAHIALCDRLGTARCRIQSMQRQTNDGEFITASLNLVVDAKLARGFQDDLDKAVDAEGGSLINRGIEAEDLSKAMVDTEARVKAKQALAERLLAIIQTRSGSVSDLVEAENAYAQAQEELEAARSWLAEMQGRVAMSDLAISYSSSAPAGSGLWQPIRGAFSEAGQMLGDSIGGLIRFVIVVAPWLLALWALVVLLRRRGIRVGWPKRWRRGQ